MTPLTLVGGWLLLALGGMGAALEMAYQLRLAGTVGAQLAFLGLQLDSHAASHWLAASAMCFSGLGMWRWLAIRGRQ